jgi:glycosyltransferase involved in cell wall biosynthesis
MACSKPVIATRVGGIPDVIEDGRNGRLVPVASTEAIADACVEFAAEPEIAARLGCAARQTIERKYDMAASLSRYVELYERTASDD